MFFAFSTAPIVSLRNVRSFTTSFVDIPRPRGLGEDISRLPSSTLPVIVVAMHALPYLFFPPCESLRTVGFMDVWHRATELVVDEVKLGVTLLLAVERSPRLGACPC